MHYRCKHRPGYADRGIKVCRRWQRFESFVQDMGPRPSPEHTIERNNNDRGYMPSNCRWATKAEQNKNRRCLVMHRGKHLAQWAKDLSINYQAFYKRYQRFIAGQINEAQLLHPGAAHRWSSKHA